MSSNKKKEEEKKKNSEQFDIYQSLVNVFVN